MRFVFCAGPALCALAVVLAALTSQPIWLRRTFWRNLASLWRQQLATYGVAVTLRTALPFTLVLFANHIALACDVFVPGWRRMEVERPIFIVGLPRSGTTYLHRLVNGNSCPADSSFACWTGLELLLPALVLRPLRAVLRTVGARQRSAVAWLGYDTSLVGAVMEEEWLGCWSLSSPILCGISAVALGGTTAPFSALAAQSDANQDAVMRFTHTLLQRQLWRTGKRRCAAKPLHFCGALRALNLAPHDPPRRRMPQHCPCPSRRPRRRTRASLGYRYAKTTRPTTAVLCAFPNARSEYRRRTHPIAPLVAAPSAKIQWWAAARRCRARGRVAPSQGGAAC